ncbi:MAG: DUF4974 domain-containing protein [Arachidicoccus sp.]|nr:DUF4974 domain-containing protein [Arachidicoccus sp.]
MTEEHLRVLFKFYLNDTISVAESAELISVIDNDFYKPILDELLTEAYSNSAYVQMDDIGKNDVVLKRIMDIVLKKEGKQYFYRKKKVIRGIAIAASMLICIGIGLLITRPNQKTVSKVLEHIQDASPGTNTATLTLANGEKIILADSLQGSLASEAGVIISKTKSGEIVYKSDTLAIKDAAISYNILNTAKHEQFQIILPDGTHVWLNAQSSLKYPVTFSGQKRIVELTGEGYFEVAKNASMPFTVITKNQQVTVLGTHFNIKSYEDEENIRTTLLEGSVNVASQTGNTILSPNEQSINTNGNIKIKKIDPEPVIAWKNGYFMFDSENLGSIMRALSRWYNVEVVFTNPLLAQQIFDGSITRFVNISEVLSMLKEAGEFNYKIEGNKVLITQ